MGKISFFLTWALDWWTGAIAVIPIALGLFAAWRAWRDGALAKARAEVKELRSDNAKLTREALIRIDDLRDCYEQIDKLQVKVIEQRERQQRLIEGDDNST